MHGRVAWIDCARGIGIILVVAGHVMTYVGNIPVSYAIFTFHMPFFVFLTSMVMKDQPWQEIARSRAHTFLVPYVTYLILVGSPYALKTFHKSPHEGMEFVKNLVLGGNYLAGVVGPFWYLTAAYIALVIYMMFKNGLGAERSWKFFGAFVVVFAIAQGISSLPVAGPLPLGLLSVPAVLLFIWIGRIMPWTSQARLLTILSLLVILAAAAVDQMTARQNFALDLKQGQLGLPVFGIMLAIAGSQLVFVLARGIARVDVLLTGFATIGRLTLPILFLHQAVHFALNAAGLQNQFAVTLLSVAVPVAFALIAQRVVPWACPYLGVPRLKAAAVSAS